MSTSRVRALTGAVGSAVLLTALAACGVPPTSNAGGTGSQAPSSSTTGGKQPSPSSTPTVPPVTMTANVKDHATSVAVDTVVKVKAADGKLNRVKLRYSGTDGKGKLVKGSVKGKLSANRKAWTATSLLEPTATYALTMKGKNSANAANTTRTTFKTKKLTLAQQTFPTLYPLKGMKVGVGMPAIVSFDVPVKNKAAIEKKLHVTSSPAQAGSWRWFSDTEVRYRPKSYWKPGTKVTVNADVNSVNAGDGIYGQSSAKTSFTVGRSMIIKVNLASDMARVYQSGKLVRTIRVTGGKPGWQTRSGIKLIMGTEYNKKMTNEMIGAKDKYSLIAKYAMRITNSGEFLHSAPWSTANQGVRNGSHGCTGMSIADSGWLYTRVLVGDPVVTTGTSRQMELGNGYGDWNISFSQYKKGSAV
jgi:lipoprotein-anchoring transpeptidase ErfK/SrfK